MMESEFKALSLLHGHEVCTYHFSPIREGALKAADMCEMFLVYQKLMAVALDSVRSLKSKSKANLAPDTKQNDYFDFGFLTDELGMVLTHPNGRNELFRDQIEQAAIRVQGMAQCKTSEEMKQHAEETGVASLRLLGKWCKSHLVAECNARISWENGSVLQIEKKQEDFELSSDVLGQTIIEFPEIVNIKGWLVGADISNNHFHIISDDNISYKGKSTMGVISRENERNIPHEYLATLEKTVRTNFATGVDRVSYVLLGLSNP